MAEVKISAIVSAYKCAEFIEGRLENLLDTSAYRRGDLGIVVVNAGNVEDEDALIRPYLRRDNVRYIRSLREPIYASWNRGIRLSRGRYITNANVDDRIGRDTYDTLANALELFPEFDVVYPDLVATKTKNAIAGGDYEPSDSPVYPPGFSWPDHDPLTLTKFYYVGPFPMWRRRLHTEYGLFDESYQLAGDYEFFLRLCAYGVQFKHVSIPGGLFYDGGTGSGNGELSGSEARRALLMWTGRIYDKYNNG